MNMVMDMAMNMVMNMLMRMTKWWIYFTYCICVLELALFLLFSPHKIDVLVNVLGREIQPSLAPGTTSVSVTAVLCNGLLFLQGVVFRSSLRFIKNIIPSHLVFVFSVQW